MKNIELNTVYINGREITWNIIKQLSYLKDSEILDSNNNLNCNILGYLKDYRKQEVLYLVMRDYILYVVNWHFFIEIDCKINDYNRNIEYYGYYEGFDSDTFEKYKTISMIVENAPQIFVF